MRKFLKVVGFLVGAVVVAVLVAMGVGSLRLNAGVATEPHPAPLPLTDSASIAEGSRLAEVYACTECHGPQLKGTDFLLGGPFMTLPAPNLRSGEFTDVDLERAIRHGVGKDGRVLIIMPSEAYAFMSDHEVGAIVGYIGSLASADTNLVERSIGPVGRTVAAFQAPVLQPSRSISQTTSHRESAGTAGPGYAPMCAACHGSDMGGQMFSGEQPVWAPNLTNHDTGLASWTLEDFRMALREGRRPDGSELDPASMPWRGLASLTDEEISGIWSHMRALEPVERPHPDSTQ